MTDPKYFDITANMVKEFDEGDAKVKIVAGKYKDHQGTKGHHLSATILDITINQNMNFQ